MHAETVADLRAMNADGMESLAAGQLVRQATAGDLEAFEELIRRL